MIVVLAAIAALVAVLPQNTIAQTPAFRGRVIVVMSDAANYRAMLVFEAVEQALGHMPGVTVFVPVDGRPWRLNAIRDLSRIDYIAEIVISDLSSRPGSGGNISFPGGYSVQVSYLTVEARIGIRFLAVIPGVPPHLEVVRPGIVVARGSSSGPSYISGYSPYGAVNANVSSYEDRVREAMFRAALSALSNFR